MLKAMEVRAPKIRNQVAMKFWFDAWNADNLQARQEYYRHMSLLEAPRMCKKKLHQIPDSHNLCMECRNTRERTNRAQRTRSAGQPWVRLTEEEITEAVRLYVEERLSIRKVGVRMGIRDASVRSALRRRGVSARSFSAAASRRWEAA